MNPRILKSVVLLSSVCLIGANLNAQSAPRPTVSNVGGIRLLAADIERARDFYGKQLGLAECHSDAAACFQVNAIQKIELDRLGRETSPSRLVFVAFEVRDLAVQRQIMKDSGLQLGDQITQPGGSKLFEVIDPEGHAVRFIEHLNGPLSTRDERQGPVSRHIIHVGYVVQNRPAMDHFYRDILGFHIYWHGGMKDDETNWVDMQVSDPHGTDWIEYMLGVSPNASHKTLGVMNHIALGVPDIRAARAQLLKNGMKLTEEPQIGRDGKWQLNLYDPDDTRVELMEFTPVQKPCCSPYTGPHPGPQSASKAPAKP